MADALEAFWRAGRDAAAEAAKTHAADCEKDSKWVDGERQVQLGERRLGALHIADAIRALEPEGEDAHES